MLAMLFAVGCSFTWDNSVLLCPNLHMNVHMKNRELLRRSAWLQWGSCRVSQWAGIWRGWGSINSGTSLAVSHKYLMKEESEVTFVSIRKGET